MNSKDCWQIFLETGAPEMYLLYNKLRKTEETYVLDSQGTGPAGHCLQ